MYKYLAFIMAAVLLVMIIGVVVVLFHYVCKYNSCELQDCDECQFPRCGEKCKECTE